MAFLKLFEHHHGVKKTNHKFKEILTSTEDYGVLKRDTDMF